jgi:hypothetical protein
VYLKAESRLFLIWLHLGLQLFTGDGKDNIYSKLICKLHFQLKVWNLSGYSVLEGGNPKTLVSPGAVSLSSSSQEASLGSQTPPAPSGLLYLRSTMGCPLKANS